MSKGVMAILYLVLGAGLAVAQGNEELRARTDRVNSAATTVRAFQGKKTNRVKVVDKKFVWGFLVPSVAATLLAAEGSSCLHHGPGGQIVRHPPCGRAVSYPVYFGLGGLQWFAVYKLKQADDEDRAAGINPTKWSRWWAWGQVWTGTGTAIGLRNLSRPACPSGTTCRL